MKKNLNEEISRIKNMMKKIITEDYNDRDEMIWDELGDLIFRNPNTHTKINVIDQYDVEITVEEQTTGKEVYIHGYIEDGELNSVAEGKFYRIENGERKLILTFDNQDFRSWFGGFPDTWLSRVQDEYGEKIGYSNHHDEYDDRDGYDDYDDNMSHNDRMWADRSDYANSRDDWDDTQKAEFKAGA